MPSAFDVPSDRAPSVMPGECLVVLGATAGLAIVSGFMRSAAAGDAMAFTNRHLYGVVGYEVLLASMLLPWLARRGWHPLRGAGGPGPADVLRGGGIWMCGLSCTWLVWIVFAALQPGIARSLGAEHRFIGVPADALAVMVVSVINPVFEEVLWLSYAVTRVATLVGMRTAVCLSLALRIGVHAYQGPWAVLGVLPVALVFTWYYVRTQRLWPVVVAHVLFDAIGLAQRLAG